MSDTLLYHLAVALGIGLIVGLERGWKTRDESGGRRLAGIRTFALAGLFGGVTAALSVSAPAVGLAAGLLALGMIATAGYVASVKTTRDFGMTTEVALLATYVLAAAAAFGYPFEAGVGAVVMTLILGFKTEVHRAVEGLERHELLATLQLAVIAVVVVPLLPDRDLGPWQALNPRLVGMLVLLIAAMSYVGYFAVRVLGSRIGVTLTAFFGGLSSSTAVTVAYARRSGEAPGYVRLFGAGIGVAAATMAARLAVEIAVVNRDILALLWPTLVALGLVPLVPLAVIVLRRRDAATEAPLALSNPLQLRTALTFGVLLSALFIAASALQNYLGDAGIYATAAVAGVVDVDAIGLALAREADRAVDMVTAARGIVLALLVNTASKAVLAAVLGGRSVARTASLTLLGALGVAAVVAALTLR